MNATEPLPWAKLLEVAQRPDLISYVCMATRIGYLRFVVELEHTYFNPGTSLNEDFSMAMSKWPVEHPYEWGTVVIPKSHKEQADELVIKSGLRIAVPGTVFGAIQMIPNVLVVGLVPAVGSEGLLAATFKDKPIERFPVQGPNVYYLESAHGSVQYSNDQDKIKAAREEEIAYAKAIEKKTADWVKTPEGKKSHDEYWASKPEGHKCRGDFV